MNPTQMDISDILQDMANGPMVGKHVSRIEVLMRQFSRNGMTLETAGDRRHLGRAQSTLQRYARQFKLTFPDYIPLALRPEKPKPEKKPRRVRITEVKQP